ncbi:hypothetical protein P4O66_003670 [Electrophorus voltai]|uniref:Uncharacterized protein n=1 Tax=Electrophorus voltai TaxID=2609070 RepID=A0AAD8ZTB0_9TELE|nr:hypothetical protein P4O66_003670 [Electrophorus voltai]
MPGARVSEDQDQFSCPVCLDLLKDPVTIPCGHSFCMVCINDCWDQEDQRGVYSCPQCRETFTPRPVLHTNYMLAEMVEKLKKTEFQAASPVHCYAGPGDVECDSCTGKKHKAIKSCLVCLASFCETHIRPHYQSPAFKKHTLVKASLRLQEKICSEHAKLAEIFCRTDKSLICYLCMMDEHKGHDTVSVAAERNKKQTELQEEQRKHQQRIQEKEKKVQELKQAVDTLKRSAQEAVEDSERIFTELIRSIEKKRCEVRELIRDQEKAELSRAEGLLDQLEQEIADLKKRDTELEQLSHTEDPIHFLQAAVEDSERIFTELIRSIEKKRCEVRELIRDQEKAELSQPEELLGQLEQEIADLKRRDTELEQLSHTEDPIHFLQFPIPLCLFWICGQHLCQHPSFDGVKKSLSDLKERIETFCREELEQCVSTRSEEPQAGQSVLTTPREDEILQLLTSSNLTTCPLEPIPSALFQTIARDLLPFISVIINNCLSSGYVPTAFKNARVNQLYDPNQSGYKPAHSTEMAFIAVTEKVHAAKAAKQSSVLILLDLSAAFDTVNHKILPSVLSRLRVTGSAWRWFQSHLEGRSYQGLCVGVVSPPLSVSRTVPPDGTETISKQSQSHEAWREQREEFCGSLCQRRLKGLGESKQMTVWQL